MKLQSLTNILIAAIIIAGVIALTNPIVMDAMSDMSVKVILSGLRALDQFCVDYQLMRGAWKDAATERSEPPTSS